MKALKLIDSRISGAHEQTGPLVMKIVKLEDDITRLKEKLSGSTVPENDELIRTSLIEKERDLNLIKHSLNELRREERNALMDKYELIEMEIQNSSYNPHNYEEQRILQRDIMKKMQTLKRLIEQ